MGNIGRIWFESGSTKYCRVCYDRYGPDQPIRLLGSMHMCEDCWKSFEQTTLRKEAAIGPQDYELPEAAR